MLKFLPLRIKNLTHIILSTMKNIGIMPPRHFRDG